MYDCTVEIPHVVHGTACGCLRPPGAMSRRGALGLFAAAAVAAAIPRSAFAAGGKYDSMLLNCIDPRFTTHSLDHMAGKGLRGKYSHFAIAGGPIGAVDPRFASWHAAFWENLDITVQLHQIGRVVALTHRDCGAAKLAFGDAAVATRQAETASHTKSLQAFKAELARRQPSLGAVLGIMNLDGSVDGVG